jgi:hypothetical protein
MRQAHRVRIEVRSIPAHRAAPSVALALAIAGLALLGTAPGTPVDPIPEEDAAPVITIDPPPEEAAPATPVAPAPEEGAAPETPVETPAPDDDRRPSPTEGAIRNELDLSNDVLARALATALQSAYDRYVGSAISIPDDVSQRLEEEYGVELSRARFVVSPAAVRLLATIDRFQGSDFGEGMHALTIDDLILLAADPAENESPYALWIWAHELHHVRQDREAGSILTFARDYLRDCDAIEDAADERANRALEMDVSVRHCLQ